MPAMVPPVSDELHGLTAYLSQQRCLVHTAAYGLTDEQARSTPTASALSVGGVIKHLAYVERNWTGILTGIDRDGDTDLGERMREAEQHFRMRPEDTLADLLADYTAAASGTDSLVAELGDVDHVVPVPRAPWFPPDLEAWSLRWVLLHLIEETARHAGHVDIIRESVDGATAFPLMAAKENWPPLDFVTPWRPAAVSAEG